MSEDLITIRKGGRPPALKKHLAIYMARLYFTEKLGKAYLADAQLMTLFGVKDDSALRRMVKKATKIAERGMTMHFGGGFMVWIEGRFDKAQMLPMPLAGGQSWVWREGLTEAVPGKVRDVRRSINLSSSPAESWGPFLKV